MTNDKTYDMIQQTYRFSRPCYFLCVLTCCTLAFLTGCGPSAKRASESGMGESGSGTAAPASASSGQASAPLAEKPIDGPEPLDLRALPTYAGATAQFRTVANVSYKAKVDAKTVFEFHRQQFLSRRWTETPGTSVADQAASGMFSGSGFRVAVSAYSMGEPGSVVVTLHNLGDTDLSNVPVPAGAKSLYAGPASAIYVTDGPLVATAEACGKLLAAAGWEPYGGAGDAHFFKKGANRLTAMIAAAPAQRGKTTISYSCEMMSADLPALPDAQGLEYADLLRRLTFRTAAQPDAIIAFYKTALAKTGWKPNQEQPSHSDAKDEMFFRNGDGVRLLTIQRSTNGRAQVTLSETTLTEINEAAKRAKDKDRGQGTARSLGRSLALPASASFASLPCSSDTSTAQTIFLSRIFLSGNRFGRNPVQPSIRSRFALL